MVTGSNLAFVTSTTVAPGALGSLAAADAMCSSLASAAGHPGTFVAWLSSRTVNAKSRIPSSALGWQRADGKPVAATLDQLTDPGTQHLWYPLRLDEHGNDVGGAVVFTGSNDAGTTGGGDCGAYASTTSTDVVTAGYADSGRRWAANAPYQDCGAPAHVYCFQIDAPVAVHAPVLPPGAKRAFVAPSAFVPGSGVAAADAACGGAAVAWFATTTTSANQRITGTGPWYRADGVEVAPAGPWTGTLAAPIEFDATGAPPTVIGTWTGAPTPSDVATTGNCSDWTSTSTNGLMATMLDRSADPFDTGQVTSGCATSSLGVYCVDN